MQEEKQSRPAHLVLAPGRFLRVIAEVDDEAAVRREVEQVGGKVDVDEECGLSPMHNVHFVKYDVTVSFDDAVSDTIRRRGGDRGIFTEEGVDTVAYFGGNHGFRV